MAQSADAYFIGRILGCSGFAEGAFCRWWVVFGPDWKVVNGLERGQTQTDSPTDSSSVCVWSHPIDLYCEFSGIQNWPKMNFEVWQHDSLGRSYLGGYGFCQLPMSPGNHDIDIPLWRPMGTTSENLTSELIGGSPHLRDHEVISQTSDRFKIQSETTGIVHLNINVILGRTSNFQISL